MLRTSLPGETGLGPHTPSACAGMSNDDYYYNYGMTSQPVQNKPKKHIYVDHIVSWQLLCFHGCQHSFVLTCRAEEGYAQQVVANAGSMRGNYLGSLNVQRTRNRICCYIAAAPAWLLIGCSLQQPRSPRH